jgi:beta-glucosidase
VSKSADEVPVLVRVRNTGGRQGRETVQVYLSKPVSAVERPVRWLAGFAIAAGEPGEEVAVQIPLSKMSFRHRAPDG